MSDLNTLSKAFTAVQAWKFSTFTLGAVCAMLAYGLIHQANTRPVVLLPYEAATKLTESVTVPTNGTFKDLDVNYLSNVAMSDISLLLNYIPENVVQQHKRFLSRLAPDTATLFRDKLESEAKALQQEGKSQSFAPMKVEVLPDSGKVRIRGKLTRILGGQVVLDTNIGYLVSYTSSQGYLHISQLSKLED